MTDFLERCTFMLVIDSSELVVSEIKFSTSVYTNSDYYLFECQVHGKNYAYPFTYRFVNNVGNKVPTSVPT